VNADDVDAVASVCKLAVDWRQKFGKDIVVDIVGYRRQGHNNLDDPRITQPVTYDCISKHPNALKIYSDQLVKSGIMTQNDIDEKSAHIKLVNDRDFQEAKSYIPDPAEWLASNWQVSR
jgi:2-oxoglutarate dehydrogenase E1 component